VGVFMVSMSSVISHHHKLSAGNENFKQSLCERNMPSRLGLPLRAGSGTPLNIMLKRWLRCRFETHCCFNPAYLMILVVGCDEFTRAAIEQYESAT
jgi:hypothetical protein